MESVARSYEDFVPLSEFNKGERSDTIVLELPGFKKEHLKVQLDNFGNLRTFGERPVNGNRWRRFRKEFRLPDSCNASEIRAKFENGILTLTLPKLISEEPAQVTTPPPTQILEPQAMPKPSEPEPEHAKTEKLKDKEKNEPEPEPAKTEKLKDKEKNEPEPEHAKTEKLKDKEKNEPEPEPAKTEKPKDKKKVEEDVVKEEKGKYGVGGLMVGMKMKRRQLMINFAVAAVIMVGVGIYVAYKFRKIDGAESTGELLEYLDDEY